MNSKKDRGRFTIRFDMTNADHVRAVEYIEQQRERGKAQYLANAVLCYEKAETNGFPQVNRALIEQVVQEYIDGLNLKHLSDLKKEDSPLSPQPIDLIANALADFNSDL